jgi:hypothetical protein
MAHRNKQPTSVPRFVRAANVELDHRNPLALDGYLLTSGARRVLGRIIPSLTDQDAPRAWTLTGPYGTGKSSFAVFASQLLAPKSAAGGAQARNILKEGDEDLFEKLPVFGKQFRGLVSVAVTGSREPLQVGILRGLKAALVGLDDPGQPALVRRVGKLLDVAEGGTGLNDRDVLDVVTDTAKVTSNAIGSGLLIIIDELGKLLEFAAAQPTKSDVYVLQHLAELAARSPVPVLVITVLHKDFSGYADRLSAHERAEWEKVRGRFEDIVFEESADEVLRLVAMARTAAAEADVNLFNQTIPTKDVARFEELANQAWKLQLAPAGVSKPEFLGLLKQCWPLHPLVAVLLGPVFRKLSQNERSVFSFLSSREPHGLLDFLISDRELSVIYGLNQLYDYMWNSLGEGLYSQRNGKKWAEVEGALDRLVNATPAAVVVLKIIGVISAIGGTKNIQTTPDVIRFGATGMTKLAELSDAIKLLEDASVITARKYNNTLSLWEGSDVDIDERVKTARERGDVSATLAALAARYVSLAPIVARRHSFETGTVRYFTVEFVEPGSLVAEAGKASEADGRILVVLPVNAEERALVENLVKNEGIVKQKAVFVAMPGESRTIDFYVRELANMEWVRGNTPQLAGDLTARRELRARVAEVERQLEVLAVNMLVPPSDDRTCEWFHTGKSIHIGSRRCLNDHLSDTCSKVFWKTPTVPNELVNRRELSSQAAAARRNLIQVMIERSAQVNLGIEGFPPERSMYMSVLQKHGIHREGEDGWEFGAPNKGGDLGMNHVWEAIQTFFDSTEKQPRTVHSLFIDLRSEPYGLRDGLLPILLCAALIANDADVALYEEGTFVPQLAVTNFERLMKSPSAYTLRRWRISGVRATVFRQLADMLGKNWANTKITKRNVLDVVRPLLKFIQQLPEYTRFSEQISDQAKRVRAALLQSREADQLLFTDLPRACGMESIDPDAHLSDEALRTFVVALRQSLGELQRHFEITLGDVGQSLGSAFGIAGDNAVIRERLTSRAAILQRWVADPALKNFVTRVKDDSGDEKSWIESVAALLCERPPNLWRDADRAKLEVAVTRIARMFRNVESLAISNGSANGYTEAIRIGVTTKDGGDKEEVVHIGPEDIAKLSDATGRMMDAMKAAGINGRKELVLAALAQMTRNVLT